jgi:hypothetical protein
VVDGDTLRARRFGDYLGEVLWLLHSHQETEDELLYPPLSKRAAGDRGPFSRIEGQDAALTSSIQAVEQATGRSGTSGSAVAGRALANALESLGEVLPIATCCGSPPERGDGGARVFALPRHAGVVALRTCAGGDAGRRARAGARTPAGVGDVVRRWVGFVRNEMGLVRRALPVSHPRRTAPFSRYPCWRPPSRFMCCVYRAALGRTRRLPGTGAVTPQESLSPSCPLETHSLGSL